MRASGPWATSAKRYEEPDMVRKRTASYSRLLKVGGTLLLTSDRNIKYQQNMTGRRVSILILRAKSNRMKDLLPLMPACAEALLSIQPGGVVEVGPL